MSEAIKKFDGEYFFLSNFHPSRVRFEGETYPTVENAFQAAKTLGDRSAFLTATPGEAKRLGRSVELRKDWESVKLDVMERLLADKFTRNDLWDRLAATGSADLVEGNDWGDRFWGVDAATGEGKNWLGVLLMRLRAAKLEAAK